MNHLNKIISQLPYQEPFLFVDQLLVVSNKNIKGTYTFPENSYFYKGHFKDNPVTPGVILIECMAQIGLVCFGIYLQQEAEKSIQGAIVLSESNCIFYKPVYPSEKVTVVSEKIYFRFNKLKCEAIMTNSLNEMVCKATLSGMLINKNKNE